VDREVNKVLDGLFRNENKGLIRLIRKVTPGLSPSEIRSSLKKATIRIEFPNVPTTPVPATESARTSTSSASSRRRPKRKKAPILLGVKITDLIQAGLINPPLELERKYKGAHLKATLQPDGNVTVKGESYDSLSTAGMARKSVIGVPPGRPYPQTNGWTFWQYLDPERKGLREIDFLRQQYLRSR
jgi:hypothetical protein